MQLQYDLTISKLLSKTVKQYASSPALVSERSRYSYGQLSGKINEIAHTLTNAGIRHKDFVGLYGSNSVSGLLMYYSLMAIGATAVFLGANLSPSELKDRVEKVPIKMLFYWSELPCCEKFSASFAVNIGDLELRSTALLFCDAGFSAANKQGTNFEHEASAPDDLDAILFTSGTTGSCKPVATTQFSRSNNAIAQGKALHLTPADKFCLVLPMHHCFSLSACILAAMAYGSCICIPENRRTKTVLKMIQDYKCTALLSVPTYFSSLLKSEVFGEYDTSSLRVGMVGGSVYPPELYLKIQNTFHIKLMPSLGQTEATAGFTMGSDDDPDEISSMTVGRFMDCIEGKFIDPASGADLPPGKIGEICIRGYNVMKGYYRMPEDTAEVLRDGWLHTGDLGYQDAHGLIYLTGRKKDLIIKGGENISPWEIENVIRTDGRVSQVKVIGIPDAHYIEEICACILPEPGRSISAEEICTMVSNHISSFKCPRYILFFDTFPLNGNGKLNINRLKEQAIMQIAQQN